MYAGSYRHENVWRHEMQPPDSGVFVTLIRMNTTDLLSAIDEELNRLEQARSLLAGITNAPASIAEGKRRGRPPGQPKAAPVKQARTMSADGRARIAAAQKARWASKKKADKAAAKAVAATPAAKKTAAPAEKAAAKKAVFIIKPRALKKAASPAKKGTAKKITPVKTATKKEAVAPPSRPVVGAKPEKAPAADGGTPNAAPPQATAAE